MQHNFVFQITFYPFQDKINKLPICNHENNLERLQTRILFNCLFRLKSQKQFIDAPDTDAILLLIQIFQKTA